MELRHIIAVGEPRATVLILHGFAEHSGRYSSLIEVFAADGYDVFFYDQPSHGLARGPRARVDIADLIAVHRRARAEVRRRMRTNKLVLFGHSMGGLITASSALIDPDGIDAVILSGPAFRQFPELPGAVSRVGYRFASLIPAVPVARLDPTEISRDRRVVEEYERDELVFHGCVPLLTGASMAVHGQRALDYADMWLPHLPLLIYHGDADGLANIEGSREFAAATRLVGAPVSLVEIEGGYHEVFKDLGHEERKEHMLGWLGTQIFRG